MQAQPVETMSAAHGPHDLPPRVLAPVYRVGLFLLFMTVSFVVFAVGHSAVAFGAAIFVLSRSVRTGKP